jgi:hypothetical protein
MTPALLHAPIAAPDPPNILNSGKIVPMAKCDACGDGLRHGAI